MKLEKVPEKVDVFSIDRQNGTILNNWIELAQIEAFDVLVIVWKLFKEETNLAEDSNVEDLAKITAILDELHRLDHKLGLR